MSRLKARETYSPATAYNVDRIEATFRAVPNASAATRSVAACQARSGISERTGDFLVRVTRAGAY